MFNHAFWPAGQAYSGFPPLSITYWLTYWKCYVKNNEFSFYLKGTENPVELVLCSWEKAYSLANFIHSTWFVLCLEKVKFQEVHKSLFIWHHAVGTLISGYRSHHSVHLSRASFKESGAAEWGAFLAIMGSKSKEFLGPVRGGASSNQVASSARARRQLTIGSNNSCTGAFHPQSALCSPDTQGMQTKEWWSFVTVYFSEQNQAVY